MPQAASWGACSVKAPSAAVPPSASVRREVSSSSHTSLFVAWLTLRPLDVPWVMPRQSAVRSPASGPIWPWAGPRRPAASARACCSSRRSACCCRWRTAGSGPPRSASLAPYGRRGRADLAGHRAAADRGAGPGRRRRLAAAEHRGRGPRPPRRRARGPLPAPPQGRARGPRGRPPGGPGSGSDPDDSQGRDRTVERRFAPLRLRSVEADEAVTGGRLGPTLAKEPHMTALARPTQRPHDRRSVRRAGPALRHLRDDDARDLPGLLPAAGPAVPALHRAVDPAALGGQGGPTAW